MIYTVTLNPAIDYVVNIDALNCGKTNRTNSEQIFFGGKGINVSRILSTLGISSTTLGFVAGFTGKAVEDYLLSQNIKIDFVKLPVGDTRINIKIKTDEETELNASGPKIPQKSKAEFLDKISSLRSGDTLVLAGSIPPSLNDTFYSEILEKAKGKDLTTVVDTTGKALLSTLKYKPFLIKPNLAELCELFNRTYSNDNDIINSAKDLKVMGAQNVLISLGRDGAILFDENGCVHKSSVPVGKALNSVGSGDSMVAGFIAGYNKTHDYSYALALGTAAGSATAFSNDLAVREDIENLFKSLYLA